MRIQLYPSHSVGRTDRKEKTSYVGFAVVAIHDGLFIENLDGLKVHLLDDQLGHFFSFLYSLKYALENDFSVQDITFHVAQDEIAYAQMRLFGNTHNVGKWSDEKFLANLKRSIKLMGYHESFLEEALEAFKWARFNKITSKGSEWFIIYYHRAVYLSALGARKAEGILNQPKSFKNWLKSGIEYWAMEEGQNVKLTYFPPFVERYFENTEVEETKPLNFVKQTKMRIARVLKSIRS